MSGKTKRIILLVALVDLVFFSLFFYAIRAYFDVPCFMRTLMFSLQNREELLKWSTEWRGMASADGFLTTWMLAAGGVTTVANLYGCLWLLRGNVQKPVLPISKRALQFILLGVGLASLLYTILLREFFLRTYPRVWMLLAEHVYLPVLFAVLLIYGLRRRRQLELSD